LAVGGRENFGAFTGGREDVRFLSRRNPPKEKSSHPPFLL
jgi:hypothetical protein